ncbi:MAG: transglycosylase domain-containing protein, partial [Myxococcota bacterium]
MLRRSHAFFAMATLQLVLGVACMGRVPGCGSTPEALERDNVLSVVGLRDTMVTYADGETPLGALFQEEHRYPVAWEDLPEAWVVAIVAAEDGRFWFHGGVDATHVARAARDNLSAGGVVAGGSTLTQQTAKNLFERQSRSLGAKFEELDQALHLEGVFDKHEILTFYANLFHVTGNGEGLGVAARYFFDKTPDQLSLLECAYLAGIVKGPANYDPFRGDAEARTRAIERAVERTRYVLERIVDEEPGNLVPTSGERLDEATVTALKAEARELLDGTVKLPFVRGRFRFDRTVVVDEIDTALDGPYFREVLQRAGIDDPDRAGLTVVTSVDLYTQHEAVYALRHHLTELGLWLEESDARRLLDSPDAPPAFEPERLPVRHDFRRAIVRGTTDAGVQLDLGGHPCVLDDKGVRRVADALHRGATGDRAARAPKTVREAVTTALVEGAVVEVSVREAPKNGPSTCDRELIPQIQGAVVVLDQGRVRAMVGGSENRDFNRVLAKRQFGSTFKPLVYHAALTLGWQPSDGLDNQPQTFRFSGTDYAPRPDHAPAPRVSIAWAGVKSENIASIWLQEHVVDRLTVQQTEALAARLNLGPEPEESPEAYGKRLRAMGVDLSRKGDSDLAWLDTQQRLAAELRGSGRADEAAAIASLTPEGLSELSTTADRCREAYDQLRKSTRGNIRNPPDLWAKQDGNKIRLACGVKPDGYRRPKAVLEGASDRRNKRRRLRFNRPTLVRRGEVELPGGLTIRTVNALGHIASTSTATDGLPPTDPRRLKANPDFRWLLGLRYVQDLAARYGVTSELPDVMSLPLGSVEISLQEAAMLYAGITSGEAATARAVDVDGTALPPPPSPALITEIRDPSGRVIYRAVPDPTRVVTASAGALTADILRNVVDHGTGRRAKGLAKVDGARIPLGGKTGTTNDFKNSAFVGFVPGSTARGFVAAEGRIVASYVGYDDNRPMKRGRIRISGASGALPAWMGTVAGITRFHPSPAPTAVRPRQDAWTLDATGLTRESVDASNGLASRSG